MVRIGVAATDPSGALASPVTVVRRDRQRGSDLDELASLIAERDTIEVVVGLPRTLRGRDSASTVDAREFAAALAQRVAPVPVRLVDERLTTVTAHRRMQAAGRGSRETRGVVDAVAAVVILEVALDEERRTGLPPGVPA
jgi:putative Holliday junction resolvase